MFFKALGTLWTVFLLASLIIVIGSIVSIFRGTIDKMGWIRLIAFAFAAVLIIVTTLVRIS